MSPLSPTYPVDPVNPDAIWFPVRITAALAGSAYTFQEVWQVSGGAVADKIGGRSNNSQTPAYAIDGSTFAVTAAGSAVQALARRADGAGGVQWELKGFGAGVTVVVSNRDTDSTKVGWNRDVAPIPNAGNRFYFASFAFGAPSVSPVTVALCIGSWSASFSDPNAAPFITVASGVGFNSIVFTTAGEHFIFGYLPYIAGDQVAPLIKVYSGTLSTFATTNFSYLLTA